MSTVAFVIFDFDAQPKEPEIAACPLCGAEQLQRISEKDRYGFAQRCDRCRDCGLAFLNPRMTKEAYARFYETAYRPLVSAFHGREINAQTIQPEQYQYARRLAKILAPWADKAKRLLDIGGSTGVVALTLAYHLGLNNVTVVDPAPDELAVAEAKGLVTAIRGSIETLDLGAKSDLITLCQTSDHLLDLMGSLRKIRGLLSKDGLFWSDIVNFDKTRETKVDHPFNLTESTYREFLKRAGFDLLQINYAPDGVHIGFLCK